MIETRESRSPAYVVHSQCTEEQKRAAAMVKELHDEIETVAYRALANIVRELNITGDQITEEQSGLILAHVKQESHKELYREGGYWKSRLKLLDADGSQTALLVKEQFEKQVNGLARLVHDRDVKLTDAHYNSLSELVMSMDDHNYMVKENLLRSWYRCPSKQHSPDMEIIEAAKNRAHFYETVQRNLTFDLRNSVQKKQQFFDDHFPQLREPERGKEFMNTLYVRHFFGGDQVRIDATKKQLHIVTKNGKSSIDISNPNVRLFDLLRKEDQEALFNEQETENRVRSCKKKKLPLLENKDMTVGEWMKTYFPELDCSSAHRPSETHSDTRSKTIQNCFYALTFVMIGTVIAKAFFNARRKTV